MMDAHTICRFASRARLAETCRIVLIVAIVVAGWSVARTFGRLVADWRGPVRPVSPRQLANADLNSMPGLLPLAGQWSFAELNWTVSTQQIAAEEVAACLASTAATRAALSDEALQDAGEDLLELIDQLSIEPIQRGGENVYHLDRPEFKAQLVLRMVAGRAKIVAFAAAFSSDNQWQLLELTPRAPNTTSRGGHPHLLPLPATARRSGGRFTDHGRLLLELVTLDSNADELLTLWRDAGWEVRPSAVGHDGAFSYLCARGVEVVYAWSANRADALQNLMLVRNPTTADTNR